MANHQQHELRLPPGFRFAPTDEELINVYLRPKLQNQPLPCNVVEEKQLYGENKAPWQVFNSDEDKWQVFESFSKNKRKVKRMIYVFAGLKKKKKKNDGDNEDGKQYIRAAGCGTWDGQSGPLDVFDSNGVKIGEKRMLVFELSDTDENRLLLHGSPNIGYWIMHEYTIAGCDYVLCSISRDDTKRPKINGAQRRKNSTKKETKFMKPKDESKKPKTKGKGRKRSVKSEKTNATNSRSIDVAMNQGYGEDEDLVVRPLAIIYGDEDERVVRTMAIQENNNFLNNVLIPEFSVNGDNVASPVDQLVQNEKDEANWLNGYMELLMGKGQDKGKTAYGISDINKCIELFDRERGEVGKIVCESYETSSTWVLGSADYGQLNYNCNGFAASVLHDSLGIVPGQIIDTRVEQQQQQQRKQRTSSSVFNVLGKRKSDAAEYLGAANKATFKVR